MPAEPRRDPLPAPDHGRSPAGLAGRGPYRFARWDGSQRLGEPTADDVLDALADDLLADGDLRSALARLLARGMHAADEPGPRESELTGLRQLRQRLAEARKALLERYRLGDVLSDVRQDVEEIVALERRGLERRLADTGASAANGYMPDPGVRNLAADLAARRQAALDALPAELGGRIRALHDYDFLEPE
ncbi:MAG: hypothetical protein M3253_06435, partial [Chloroflexota bacterium]|nr:hypothetical protein [Chloroflexota bacterium]